VCTEIVKLFLFCALNDFPPLTRCLLFTEATPPRDDFAKYEIGKATIELWK
jgi:hypothetical protein